MNAMNSIPGIDDFADEMKKNLTALEDLRAKYQKVLDYLNELASREWCLCSMPADPSCIPCVAYKLLCELNEEGGK